jgi:hypothetical protein
MSGNYCDPLPAFGENEQEFLARLTALDGVTVWVGSQGWWPEGPESSAPRAGPPWTPATTRPGSRLSRSTGTPCASTPACRSRWSTSTRTTAATSRRCARCWPGWGCGSSPRSTPPAAASTSTSPVTRTWSARTRRRTTRCSRASPVSTSSRSGATCSCPARCGPSTTGAVTRSSPTSWTGCPSFGRTTTAGRRCWPNGWPSSGDRMLRRRRARHLVAPASGPGTPASRGTARRPMRARVPTSTPRWRARSPRSRGPPRAGATRLSSSAR